MSEPVRSIRILGDGLEAWLCAKVLRSAVDEKAVAIEMQPTGTITEEVSHYSILRPAALAALETFGVSLPELLRLPSSLPSLGQVVRTEGRSEAVLPYGGRGIDWAGTGFHHHWLRARQAGLPHPYFAFSPGYHAILGNRFAPPDRRNAIDSMQHESGLHVSPGEIVESLKASLAGKVTPLLKSAKAPPVDLLIHAAGSPGLEADQFELHAGPARPCAIRLEAPHRTRLQLPLRPGWLDLPAPAGPASCRPDKAPWIGNELHLGISAARIPGLEDRSMDRLLFELQALLDHWPRSGPTQIQAMEYNRLWAQEYDEWAALGALVSGEPDDRCDGRRALFQRRGYVEPLESDTIDTSDWVDAFIARDVIPAHYDRLSERLSDPQLKTELQRFSDAVRRTVAEFPDFPAYLQAIDQALGRPPLPAMETSA